MNMISTMGGYQVVSVIFITQVQFGLYYEAVFGR